MRLNADFSARTAVHAAALDWLPSPAKGVERRMLFRIGDEKARATSIVRYAPNSEFAPHGHPGGEEFLVLEGTFQDETGDFPVGTYVRNPPGTAHAPKSADGCTIFVKLWQFRRGDRERIVHRTSDSDASGQRAGVRSSVKLFDGAGERVMLESWEPEAVVEVDNTDGLELLVLSGMFADGAQELLKHSWLRLPAHESLRAHVGPAGARVWFKLAPLMHADVCRFEDVAE